MDLAHGFKRASTDDGAIQIIRNGIPHAFPDGEGRVLFPRADIAPEGLEEKFRAKGWTPVRVDAYRTRYPDTLPKEAGAPAWSPDCRSIAFLSGTTDDDIARTGKK